MPLASCSYPATMRGCHNITVVKSQHCYFLTVVVETERTINTKTQPLVKQNSYCECDNYNNY